MQTKILTCPINRFWFLILAYLLCFGLPASAAKTKGPGSKYVTVPVYYVTDRNLKGDDFGSHRRYPMHCLHEMYYGTAYIGVPNAAHKEPGTTFSQLGWKPSDEKPAKVSNKEMINPANGEAAKREFFKRIKAALDQSGKDELCVFVHGACDAFEDCAQDAASMAYYLQTPVVLYSWPSNPKWRSYFVDGVNSEYSQGHFNTFCKDLVAFKQDHPLQVLFCSHSMGNRLVIRSLPVTYGKGLVSEWELISPDMDADTTRHYIMGLEPDKSKIRLYVSNKDKMLPLAQLLSGGYYRLGEAANAQQAPSNPGVTPGNFERIDFTAIDTGLHGHSIPFSLVANIARTDQPGDQLQLVPETSVHANRLVRFVDRKEKLASTTQGLSPEYCKRVVKVK